MMLRVGDIRWETEAEGPGRRTAIWTQGCTVGCAGCCNPELLPARGGTQRDPEELAAAAARRKNGGITLLGGEPLDQAAGTIALLKAYRSYCGAQDPRSIWMFTGYSWETIQQKSLLKTFAALCDVVIAGPYDHSQTPDPRKWIGSRNQTIHILCHRETHLRDAWPQNQYEIELTVTDGEVLVNGWPVV
jgi:anaerobic ribonucleoside-triphosphate reductase activating protein